MEKRINGKRYDPDRAALVGRSPAGALYRKLTGEHFLVVDGDIRPLQLDEARDWAKEHLTAKDFKAAFASGDDGGRVVCGYTVQKRTAQCLQDFAALERRTRGEIVDDAVELYRQTTHPDFYKE